MTHPLGIRSITAAEILDSRGVPTVEAVIALADGTGRASIPSGKSTGQHEALERRDHESRYWGMGVQHVVAAINDKIAPPLLGTQLPEQPALDRWLRDRDGTPNKSRLGANAILAVSLAGARARAAVEREELYVSLNSDASLLPVPCFNVINGGAHADNALELQEFMIVPAGLPTFAEALRTGAEVYHALAAMLEEQGLSTAVGDEGGFAPAISEPEQALELLVRAIERAGYRPDDDVSIALDPAANGFHRDGLYWIAGKSYDAAALTSLYAGWLGRFPILSIEDGLAEEDVDGWRHLTRELGQRIQIVGDDIFVSSAARVTIAAESGIANAVLLKPNQIGTLTEIIQTAQAARSVGFRMMMSHRSGETDDAFIADLAVALDTGQIKAGAPARGERVAKYNRLLAIERDLGTRARFAGRGAFAEH